VDALAPSRAAFVALNPLHAIANREPYNTSPYLPECSLYRNFLYLDVEQVPGFEPGDQHVDEIKALRETDLVEYERVAKVKLAALCRAFVRFRASGHTGGFEEYASLEGQHLEDYAVYCALWKEMHARNPGFGCGPNGRRSIAILDRRRWRIGPRGIVNRSISTNFCSGRSTGSSRPCNRMRSSAG